MGERTREGAGDDLPRRKGPKGDRFALALQPEGRRRLAGRPWLLDRLPRRQKLLRPRARQDGGDQGDHRDARSCRLPRGERLGGYREPLTRTVPRDGGIAEVQPPERQASAARSACDAEITEKDIRSEEQTSELQSLMR